MPPESALYCPQCGQQIPTGTPTVHEYVARYLAFAASLWRTLVLLFRPGRLTREYLDGRRRGYVPPLKLYLTVSAVFFVVAKLLASSDAHVTANAPPASIQLPRASDCGTPGHADCTLVERWLKGRTEAARRNPQAFAQNLDAKAIELAPYAMFVLLPVFAAIMQLAWFGRGLKYGEHFVFSLHLHTFWFLDLMASNLLLDPVGEALTLVVPVYAVMAMRTVYGGGWPAAIARGVAGLLLYGVALTAALFVTLVVVISMLG
jgi:hypothetical protein